MSALRQRMVDAMQVRGLSARTIECYTESISRLSRHFGGVNPDRLEPAQIEAYLLHLVKERQLSYSSVNHAASACRFLFEKVLGRPSEIAHLRPPMAKVPQKQPELLSRLEIGRLFEACRDAFSFSKREAAASSDVRARSSRFTIHIASAMSVRNKSP